MTLDQITAQAENVDAIDFAKFLEVNNINNTWLDVCLTNYNEGYFNITLDDYDGFDIIFYNGVYER